MNKIVLKNIIEKFYHSNHVKYFYYVSILFLFNVLIFPKGNNLNEIPSYILLLYIILTGIVFLYQFRTWKRLKQKIVTEYKVFRYRIENIVLHIILKTGIKISYLDDLRRRHIDSKMVYNYIDIGVKLFKTGICLTVITIIFEIHIQIISMPILFKFSWLLTATGIAMISFQIGRITKQKKLYAFLFGEHGKYERNVKICKPKNDKLIIDIKNDHDIDLILSTNHDDLFIEIIKILSKWNPKSANSEDDYRNSFIIELKQNLIDQHVIKKERKIGQSRNQGIYDILINNNILIEVKSDSRQTAIDRANGQIERYAKEWNNKGPIILLLFDYSIDKANQFNDIMRRLWRKNQEAITIIAKKNKN